MDTVLAKVLAESDDTEEMYTLVDGTNDVVIEEVEATFEKNGQYNALCKLYEKAGKEDKLLEAWSKYVTRPLALQSCPAHPCGCIDWSTVYGLTRIFETRWRR